MSKTCTPPTAYISPYPYIGIIKSYDDIKKYGYIMVAYKKDIFFHINNSNIKSPKPNTFIAFKVRESSHYKKVEAYEVDTITNYKNELLMHSDNLLCSDKNILYYRHIELLTAEIYKKLKEEYEALCNLDNYIDNYNIREVIASYSVKVVTGHIYKPGDDDSVSVDFNGDREKGVYIIKTFGKYLRDEYVDTILPVYKENIFHDRGFCPWERMLESFGSLEQYEQDAEKLTREIREQALRLYDKHSHKSWIMKFLVEKITKETIQYQKSIVRSINDSLSYTYNLNCKLEDMTF